MIKNVSGANWPSSKFRPLDALHETHVPNAAWWVVVASTGDIGIRRGNAASDMADGKYVGVNKCWIVN